MRNLEAIASILNEDLKEIERKGIKIYLEQRLKETEVKIIRLTKNSERIVLKKE